MQSLREKGGRGKGAGGVVGGRGREMNASLFSLAVFPLSPHHD